MGFLCLEENMADIIKEYNSELVIMDQFLSSKGNDFYMNLAVAVEVVKSGVKPEFRTYVLNTINPKMRVYITNSSLTTDVKLESCYYLLFNGVLEYLHQKEFGFNDTDLSYICNHYNDEDHDSIIEAYLKKKKKADKLETAKSLYPVFDFAISAYTNYKAAKSDVIIDSKHINSLKMLIGKEFMDNVDDSSSSENTSITKSVSGCYIATCVYGSYNCPEVYRLRRYRDYYLKKRKLGRLFIKMYYATSPSLVKHFGNKKLFRKIFKSYLDKKLIKLENRGYSDTPYND